MDLKANTAVDVLIGPFVDATDGNTTEDALTLTQAEIKLSKNGQALTQKNDATSATFDDDGYYNCELDATDTNTEGNLVLIVHQSANALPVRHEFNVLSEAAWDSLYAAKDTGFMDVNVKAVSEDETAANNLETACDNYSATRGLSGTALPAAAADAAGGLPISDLGELDLDTQLAATNEVTAARMGALTDWINGGRLDLLLDAIETDTSTTIPGTITTAQNDLDIITGASGVNLLTATQASIDAIEADTSELQADDTPTTLAAIITDLDDVKGTGFVKDTHSLVDIEAYVDILDDGTSGNAKIATDAAAILVDTATTIPGTITTAQNDLDIITGASGVNLLTATQASIDAIEVDTSTTIPGTITTAQNDLDIITGASGVNLLTATQASIDAIEADTSELQADDTPTTLAAIITDLDDIKGTGFVKDTHSLVDIEAYVDILDDGTSGNAKIATDAAAILVDTGTTIPGTITTIDTEVGEIKTVTDKLQFTATNYVQVDLQYLNAIELTGDGTSGTEWGPA
ncbi:MAG: hypothetical protein GY896_11725 [Gammaproteobacteria bacterium]|nr:hypothetical protein [Gammaproteobacteria bacterium]